MPQYSASSIIDAERRPGEFLENAPDAILELDKDGRIVLLSRMAERLSGYTREEMQLPRVRHVYNSLEQS